MEIAFGEWLTGFEAGNEKGGSLWDVESFAQGVGFEWELARERGVRTRDDDDVVFKFFERFSEIFVKRGCLFRAKRF